MDDALATRLGGALRRLTPDSASTGVLPSWGHSSDTRGRLEGLIADVAGPRELERSLLVAALQEGVPEALLSRSTDEPVSSAAQRLAHRLADRRAVELNAAMWAARAWAVALGIADWTSFAALPIPATATAEPGQPWLHHAPTNDAVVFPGPPSPDDRRRHRLHLLVALAVVFIVAAAGTVVALVAAHGRPHHSHTHSYAGSAVGATSPGPATGAGNSASSAASAMSRLLVRSTSDRTGLQAPIANLMSCNDVDQATTQLGDIASSRQQLLGDVESLNVSALPGGAQLQAALETAWRDSLQADQAYVSWGADLEADCFPSSSPTDTNYLAALRFDGDAEAAKARFVTLWNPVAEQYGLPTQTDNSF